MNQKAVNEIMQPFEKVAPDFHREMSAELLKLPSISLDLINRLQKAAKEHGVKIRIRLMDPYLVSDQPWELDYIAHKFKCSRKAVRAVKKLRGRSRRAIYRALRAQLSKSTTLKTRH